MRNNYWIWFFVSAAVVLSGAYAVMTYLTRNPVPPMPGAASPAVTLRLNGNPLLTADKAAVSRWFPGFCFAEIYNKNPSYNGKLIPNCMKQVIQQIKIETGITIAERDIRTPEVFAHFKQVYGDDGKWLR